MRKAFIILCVFLILFSFTGCQKHYTHEVYEITFKPNLIYNNGVGREWEFYYFCDGETIESGKKWVVPIDTLQTKTIDVTIIEKDDWNDVSYGTLIVDLKDGFQTSERITVFEYNTRFNFNNAEWEIKCEVKLVKKLEKTNKSANALLFFATQ